MNKRYTRKQIREAIKYWEKQLSESELAEPEFEFFEGIQALERLNSGDITRIAELRRQLYDSERSSWRNVGANIPDDGQCTEAGVKESLLESPYTVVARLDSEIVGFLLTSIDHYQYVMPGNVYIDEDCVDEKLRGMGIGTKMV